MRIESGRRVVPTELGVTLVRGYQLIDPELCKPQVRAHVEAQVCVCACCKCVRMKRRMWGRRCSGQHWGHWPARISSGFRVAGWEYWGDWGGQVRMVSEAQACAGQECFEDLGALVAHQPTRTEAVERGGGGAHTTHPLTLMGSPLACPRTQIGLVAKGTARKEAVVAHTLAQFKAKARARGV